MEQLVNVQVTLFNFRTQPNIKMNTISDNRCEEVHQDLKIRLVDFFRKNSVLCSYIFRSASEVVCETLGSVMDNKIGKVFSFLIILFNIG